MIAEVLSNQHRFVISAKAGIRTMLAIKTIVHFADIL
jgi:hypothetical protein